MRVTYEIDRIIKRVESPLDSEGFHSLRSNFLVNIFIVAQCPPKFSGEQAYGPLSAGIRHFVNGLVYVK